MDDDFYATVKRLRALRENFDDGPRPKSALDQGTPVNPLEATRAAAQAAAMNAAHVRLQTLQWARQRLTTAPDFPTARQAFDAEIAVTRNAMANLYSNDKPSGPYQPGVHFAAAITDASLKPYVDAIVGVVEEAFGIKAYVSEKTSLSDFRPRDMSKTEFLVTLAKKLDVFIDPNDTSIMKVANDMRKRR